MTFFYNFRSCLVLGLAALLLGCAAGNQLRPSAKDYPRAPSHAISQDEKTSLKNALQDAAQENPGMSGFRIFEKGGESLMARLALVRLAEKSIDLQYYGIGSDISSKLMMEAIIQAAKRGVRVRLLIDAFTIDEMEETLLAFNGIQNLEVRVFNPLHTDDQPVPAKLIGYLTDFPQANKRMHNKAMISDNQMAIVGGRNLSDEYFEANENFNFRDLDVLTAGPITARISNSFDQYWNGPDTFPIAAVYDDHPDQKEVEKIRNDLIAVWNREIANPKRRAQLVASIDEVMAAPDMKMVWAKGELAADTPQKIRQGGNALDSKPFDRLLGLLDDAQKEFIAVTPYFVPKKEGVDWLGRLEQQGVDVKILTNSLASTDVVATHSGYAPYRKALLQRGVELYELMTQGKERPEQRLAGREQPPQARLHSKVYIVDGQHTLIGSFNLDQRSVELNTELALVIHSAEIGAQMKSFFTRATAPQESYRLELDKDGDLKWRGIEKGVAKIFETDPHSGIGRRIQTRIADALPIEDQL